MSRRPAYALALLLVAACSDDTTNDVEAGADAGITADTAGADTVDPGDAGATFDAQPDGPTLPVPTYYQDVKPILDAHCVGCHVDGGVGPFQLVDFESASTFGTIAIDSIRRGAMPPWDAEPVTEYLYDPSLSVAQIETLEAWVAGGMPMGDPAAPAAPTPIDLGELSRADVTLGLPAPYVPEGRPDEYRCFVLDWDLEAPTYVTGFRASPTSLEIAHHAIAWHVPAGYADAVDGAAAVDGRPGYDCFGSASPPEGPDFSAGILGAWAPGTDGFDYPEGTGALINPGDRIVLQMHYSVATAAPPVPDEATVSFSLEDEVELAAGSVAHFNLQWFANGETMRIPAGETGVEHTFAGPMVGGQLAQLMMPATDLSTGMRLYAVIPHLHQIGDTISMEVEHADGSITPIVQVDAWDFNWQRQYWLAEPIDLGPEDIVHLRCSYDNSMANQPIYQGETRQPADVGWGDGSFDEMCLGLFFVSELPE